MDSKPVVLRVYQREILANLRAKIGSREVTVLPTGFGKMGMSDRVIVIDEPHRRAPRGRKSDP
jgi:hypothetical protein